MATSKAFNKPRRSPATVGSPECHDRFGRRPLRTPAPLRQEKERPQTSGRTVATTARSPNILRIPPHRRSPRRDPADADRKTDQHQGRASPPFPIRSAASANGPPTVLSGSASTSARVIYKLSSAARGCPADDVVPGFRPSRSRRTRSSQVFAFRQRTATNLFVRPNEDNHLPEVHRLIARVSVGDVRPAGSSRCDQTRPWAARHSISVMARVRQGGKPPGTETISAATSSCSNSPRPNYAEPAERTRPSFPGARHEKNPGRAPSSAGMAFSTRAAVYVGSPNSATKFASPFKRRAQLLHPRRIPASERFRIASHQPRNLGLYGETTMARSFRAPAPTCPPSPKRGLTP